MNIFEEFEEIFILVFFLVVIAVTIFFATTFRDTPPCEETSITSVEIIKVRDGWTKEDLIYIYHTDDGGTKETNAGVYKIGEKVCQ